DPGRSGAGIRPGAEHWALSEFVPRLWPHPCGTVGGEAGRWNACSRQPAPGTQQRRRRTARTGAGAGRGTATPLCGERLSPAIVLVVQAAEADWRFTPCAEGTEVRWEYRFAARGWLARLPVTVLAHLCFRPAMRRSL